MRSRPRSRVIASLALVLAFGCGGSSAPATCPDRVCPCNASGIRAALDAGFGLYTFDCDGPTRVFTGAELVIERDVALDGGGNLTVDANGRHRVFSVEDGVTAELIGLTVANGNEVVEHGGGIRNEGTLTLTNSTVFGSNAGRANGCRTDDPQLLCSEGGGIWNAGTLTVTNSTITDCTAHFGGGIANRGGTVTIRDSTVSMSTASGCRGTGAIVCSGGGGIWNSGALMMVDSVVSGSIADWGGGVFNRGDPTFDDSTISGNGAAFDGGGLLNFETMTLVGCTVDDNTAGQSGGAIANEAGVLDVSSSTLSRNEAISVGGGVFNPSGALTTLLNTTVSGNTAGTGGGIYTGGEIAVTQSTIARNVAPTASALFDPQSSDAEVRSIAATVIEGGCAGSSFDSGGYNVESPGNTCGLDTETDQPSEPSLGLGPLGENGGPTETHALEAGSVAIDQIPRDECLDGAGVPLVLDQRGEPRPAGVSCDVGAYEAQP